MKQKRILVVDDDPSVREMLGRVLSDEGYLVFCAASGPEALTIAAGDQIDLVLLDLNMPGQNGWDTYADLTTHNPFLAIIIITAKPGQLFTALGAGVGALMEKPLDFEKLLETARKLLSESAELRLARAAGYYPDVQYAPPAPK